MGFLDIFKKPPAVDTVGALEDFLDSRSAFMVQKCIWEYSRARAGIQWQKLFKEEGFKEAIEISRWRGFPLMLGNVAEMVEGALRKEVPGRKAELLDAMIATCRAVIHRYPVPRTEADDYWTVQVDWLEKRLARIQLAAPKPVGEVPLETIDLFYEQVPVHETVRQHDYVLIRNHIRMNLVRAYEDFVAVADPPALVERLLRPDEKVSPPGIGA